METKQRAPFSLAVTEGRRNYLVHFSTKHDYVYVEVPKTGCTTVKRVLQLAELEGDRERLPNEVHDRQQSPLLSPAHQPKEFAEVWRRPEVLRVTFVRNPFTRILSAYLDKIVTNDWERAHRLPSLGLDSDARVELIEFLQIISGQSLDELDIHWAPQSVLTGVPHNRFDHVYAFEAFGEAMADLLRRLGVPQYIEESRVRTAHATNAHAKLSQYYGPKEIDAVIDIFRDDFALFGYSTDIDHALDEPLGLHASGGGDPTAAFMRPRAGSEVKVNEVHAGVTTTTTQYGPLQRVMRNGPVRNTIVDSEEYRDGLAAALAAELASGPVDLVSVDVFDTVLVREPTSELRRFYEMAVINAQHESRLLDVPVTGVDMLLARLHATHGSYRLSEPVEGCREGTIDQIARIVASSLELSDGAPNRLIQRELEYEQRHLTLNQALLQLLDELSSDGVQVILLSDMYLRDVDIRGLLDYAGVKRDFELFSSADIRISKRSGKAFDFVAKHAGTSPSAMLHIGDSLYSDFQMARRSGARAIHLPVPDGELLAIRRDHADVAARLADQGVDVTRWIKSV